MIFDKVNRSVQLQVRFQFQLMSSFRMQWCMAFPFVFTLCLCFLPVQVVLAQSTCLIQGITYQAGEPLGESFTTRCGSPSEFPCFCQPNATSQIDCPYCGIATLDNDEGLVCAIIDGPFVNITSLQGEAKECTCRRDSNGNPETICVSMGSNPNNVPSTSPPTDAVCTLEWADGSVDIFQDGQSYGELFSTQCGPPTEYPCFCNVSVPGKLYCPYCSVTTSTGSLACGGIGETFILINENQQEVSCNCQGNLEANCFPTSTAATTIAPSTLQPVAFVPAPTPLPTFTSTDSTTTTTTTTASSPVLTPYPTASPTPFQPTLVPTLRETATRQPSVPLPTLDKPSILLPSRTPPVSVPVPGCAYVNATTGEQGFSATGATLDFVQGPCAPRGSFPAICNPALPGGVEYPYCVFTMDGQWDNTIVNADMEETTSKSSEDFVVCAKNGDQVAVPTAEGTVETCSCLYLNPFIGAVSSCPDLLVTIPLALTMLPTSAPSLAPSLDVPIQEQPTLMPIVPTSGAVTIPVSLKFLSVLVLLLTQL